MKERWPEEARRGIELAEKGVFLLAVPFAAFYMMQFIFGGMPWEYSFSVALGNALCIGAVYYPLCALTGRPVISGLIIVILAGVWGAANYYIVQFRGNPILPWDLTALQTAVAVSGSYHFSLTWRMVLALFLAGGADCADGVRQKAGRAAAASARRGPRDHSCLRSFVSGSGISDR